MLLLSWALMIIAIWPGHDWFAQGFARACENRGIVPWPADLLLADLLARAICMAWSVALFASSEADKLKTELHNLKNKLKVY